MWKKSVWKWHSAFHERFCLDDIGRNFDARSLCMGLKKQYLIQTNALIAQEVRRMRAANDLSSSTSLHCRE